MVNYYLDHLLSSIEKQKRIAVTQTGKADIEPPDYCELVERWFSELTKAIQEKKPLFYVRAINIYQHSMFEITDINYSYFERDDIVKCTSINIFDFN